jgi:tetratricopeptide (TPR) repeat protein
MNPLQEIGRPDRDPEHSDPVDTAEELERATALEHAGAWESAAALYRRVFANSIAGRDVAGVLDALYGQARMDRELRRWDEAEELVELCRTIADRADAPRMEARALNLHGVIKFSRGDMASARTLYEEAVERARDAGDDQLIGYACQNLGVLANIRGDLREARVLYLESVGASVRSGDRTSAAMVYNNLGMVCTDLGEYLEAEIYFDRGVEMAEWIPDVPMLARLYANRAEPMIRVGDHVRARGSLDKADALAQPIHAASTLADVARFRGVIAAATGDLDEAERQITSSLAIAEGAGLRLARAEGLEELASLHERRGHAEQALEALRGAHASYTAIGASHDAARIAARIQ